MSDQVNPASVSKLPDLDILEQLYTSLSGGQIAAMFGVSRALVQSRLSESPQYNPRAWSRALTQELMTLYRQTNDLPETARRAGVSLQVARRRLKKIGIYRRPPPKQPGCPTCQKNHYARGYCKKCYARWKRLQDAQING